MNHWTIGLLICLLTTRALAQEPGEPPWRQADLRRGQSPADVRRLAGKPDAISRQILLHRHLEQWYYGTPVELIVEIVYCRGDEPMVIGIWRQRPAP